MLVLSGCLEEGISPAVKSTLEAVAQEYAPDGRVAVFKIKPHLENDSLVLSGETNLPEARQALLQRLEERGIEYLDQITVLPAPALNGYEYGVVNVSVANIRSNPKHSAELATQALLGTGLKVYKSEGEWYYIQSPDGYLGWMDSGSFKLMDQAAYQQWLDAGKVIFTADYGFVLDAPTPNAGRLGDLVSGNILLIAAPEAGYHGVIYPDGRRGYISKADAMLFSDWFSEKTAVSPAAFISSALDFMGRPYLWGGTSGKGMDCSGFTKTVYFMNGFVIPRDASQQVNAGIDIPTDSTLSGLEAGDFLFFGQKAQADQPERIRHVGIYLGQGRFIHSGADNPGVRVESLWPDSPNFAGHRLESFVRARRMEIGSPGIMPINELTDFYGMRPAVSSMQD
jgi:hypothetical protein